MSDPSRVALIIGIDSYNDESLEDLPACRQDAEDLCQLLSQNLNYKIFEDGPIIGSKLNKENGWIKIREAIGNFFLDAKPRQTLLFYFSGHGIPRDGDVYLGAPQIEYKKPSIKGYSLAELTEKMMTSTLSKQIVCIVDACYSGAAKLDGSKSSGKDTSAVASATYDKVWKRVPKAEGKYLLLSSQSYERSLS